jgi:hypothetical protein
MQDIFYEAVFKFDRTDDNCDLLYTHECPGVITQIIVPILYSFISSIPKLKLQIINSS